MIRTAGFGKKSESAMNQVGDGGFERAADTSDWEMPPAIWRRARDGMNLSKDGGLPLAAAFAVERHRQDGR